MIATLTVFFIITIIITIIFTVVDCVLIRDEIPFEFVRYISIGSGTGVVVFTTLIYALLLANHSNLFVFEMVFGALAFASKIMLGMSHFNCLGLAGEDVWEKYNVVSAVGFTISAGCLLGMCLISAIF